MGMKKVARKNVAVQKFISEDAKDRYINVILKRTLAPERGFLLKQTQDMGYPEMVHSIIAAHEWRQFCMQPEGALVPLVREFYANFPEGQPTEVEVRGVKVQIGSEAINQYYGIQGVVEEHADFIANISEKVLTDVLCVLCVEGTSWDVSEQGAFTFRSNCLRPAAKVWYHFLKSRLMPSTHIQTVSKDRALLLYCILEKKRINVGRIIYEEMCNSAQKSSGHIWFPSLVSGLCEAAGVAYIEGEEQLKMTGVMTPAIVARIAQEKGLKRAREAELEEDAPGPSTQPPSKPAAAATSPPDESSSDLIQMLKLLQQKVNEQEEQQQKTMALLQQLQAQQQQYWKYAKARDLALRKSLQKNFTKPVFKFPDFPEGIFENMHSEDADDEEQSAESSSHHTEASNQDVNVREDPVSGVAAAAQAKGKEKMDQQPAGGRPHLRSASSWKWKERC